MFDERLRAGVYYDPTTFMRVVDRIFGWLLVLGAIMHAIGSYVAVRDKPDVLVWAQSGTLAALLVAALNLLRVNRPADRTLSWVSAAGSIGWMLVAIGVGLSVGNLLDPNVMYHIIVGGVLAAFSIRGALSR